MKANLFKLASVLAFTFIGAFCGALTIPPGASTWAALAPVIGGALLSGGSAVVHLFQLPPSGAPSLQQAQVAALLSHVEEQAANHLVAVEKAHPAMQTIAAHAQAVAADLVAARGKPASDAIEAAFAKNLADLTANPTPDLAKKLLDAVPAIAASTPVEPPAGTPLTAAERAANGLPPLPANDTTQGAS